MESGKKREVEKNDTGSEVLNGEIVFFFKQKTAYEMIW